LRAKARSQDVLRFFKALQSDISRREVSYQAALPVVEAERL